VVSIILISHGNLAEELLNTSKLIMGEQKNVVALGLEPDESRECLEKRIKSACEELYQQDGILILADLFGGTPTNAAILGVLGCYEKIELLSGANLPMLLDAFINRNTPLKELTYRLKQVGKNSIINAKDVEPAVGE